MLGFWILGVAVFFVAVLALMKRTTSQKFHEMDTAQFQRWFQVHYMGMSEVSQPEMAVKEARQVPRKASGV